MRLVPAHGYVRRALPDRPVQAPAGSAPRGLHVLRKGCSGGCCQSCAPPPKERGFMTNAPPETPNVSLGSIRNSVLPIILVFEPVCAGRHDDFIALLFTETIFAQNAAFVLDIFLAATPPFLPFLRTAPTVDAIGTQQIR